MMDTWLTTLITATPQEGYELAITLSRRGVKYTQPDAEVLQKLRPQYANDPNALTAASQVIAINFQTVAAANNYWKK
ncbi:MAG: hexameric tyrosine-coordinated heme protein [Chitinophagaceae bacterium]|nr:hexameric tyrosine-coordinated heme protein [Chitinophagaceae bacterium]MBK7345586.1 hexameric tyrosine-coordinated heme protein [Chitinophagaceae bacterium]MBK7734922.1 hexameric tyrosine-coordinated heme protein [Chitinophagaceae bacterium]MBK8930052.1 hexameric tyrosine-coordinated heme protein [Chitinophagaceae bacterium]MBK9959414.1 hexameric tyrosine-coordinated heme protein [Chitinophagaceae bacterium]